ncbi:MAG: endonuclease III, partial [Gammaproteobacteria bacterium]
MNPEKRRKIFERLRAANPHPTTELHYSNVFQLLVAVVLSAQATDKGVNKATAKLFKLVSTPRDILALGEAGLKDSIKTIGLFNSKAKNLLAACAILEARHAGQVPHERAA